jgi:hypothetical protein
VDVADPVPYLNEALECNNAATAAGTLALVAGGAFPGCVKRANITFRGLGFRVRVLGA